MRLLLLGLLLSTAANAQTGTITGTVRDGATGETLPGANVHVEGKHVQADIDGRFTIRDVPVGTHDVVASFAGYKPTTKPLTVLQDTSAVVDLSLSASYPCGVCVVPERPAPTFARTAYTARVLGPEIVYVSRPDRCCVLSHYEPVPLPRFEVTLRDAH